MDDHLDQFKHEGQDLVDRLIAPVLEQPEGKLAIIISMHDGRTYSSASLHLPAPGQDLGPRDLDGPKHLAAHAMKLVIDMIATIADVERRPQGAVHQEVVNILKLMRQHAEDPFSDSYSTVRTIRRPNDGGEG